MPHQARGVTLLKERNQLVLFLETKCLLMLVSSRNYNQACLCQHITKVPDSAQNGWQGAG